MASVLLSIGQVNITGHLLVVLRYTDDPIPEAARQSIAPGNLGPVNNLTFPNINPKPVFVDVRESPDGIALGTLLSTFQINVTNKINILERRFYTVGGIGVGDPDPDTYVLSDPYFDGKIVSGLFREGYRHLKEGIEWKRAGNDIQLLNPETLAMDGPVFNAGEVYVVEILYLQDQIWNESGEGYTDFADITANTTLSITNRQRVNVINAATSTLIITLELLSSISNGEWYEFITNDGSQYQTILQCSGSDKIRFAKKDLSRIVIGTGEFIRIAKRGTYYQVIRSHSNILEVGRFFKSYNNNEVNGLLCDSALYNGAEYPRVVDYIKSLPANFVVIDGNINNPGWIPASGKEGCWYYYDNGSTEYFRTPNKQGYFVRNLKSFSQRANDTTRGWDYPGGKQLEEVGPHFHFNIVNSEFTNSDHPESAGANVTGNNSMMRKYNKTSGGGKESYTLAGSNSAPTIGRSSMPFLPGFMIYEGVENRPENIGEFEFVRI